MSDTEDNPPAVDAAENSFTDTSDSVPVSESHHTYDEPSASRCSGKPKTVHEFLGGGRAADVLLWREKFLSSGLLFGTTIAWVVFHWWQVTLLSVASNVLLLLFISLFIWSNVTSLLNRPPPPIPKLHLSEDSVQSIAKTLRIELNAALGLLHAAALGKDLKLFLKVSASLWFLSIVGGWFSSLTLLYSGIVAALTSFVIYDKYEHEIDKYSKLLVCEAKKQYKKIDELVLSKIPKAPPRDKKSE
ncbi:hypothetical protein O6H91_03G057900 [Diphasiastrum complanatum]|uniref:Uncharacterized protein n=3 Tax=Diphasiastrum complanatum TaxID=34168 RepID=A0ACC2E7B7_DIPCM|nr:hypothetical protein O6H91_03G057900 [Diphasiastrum complanatum]KAJ7562188.1 hypothetical protein O6H91_03G057900 [Diphasiastrum complanatum]KAJ7562189.1 hypothetical protein O6H91_03G057900 [Diphasiastrum complanatum]